MDKEAWRAAVHGDPKSRTWLSDWTELNLEYLPLKLALSIKSIHMCNSTKKGAWNI